MFQPQAETSSKFHPEDETSLVSSVRALNVTHAGGGLAGVTTVKLLFYFSAGLCRQACESRFSQDSSVRLYTVLREGPGLKVGLRVLQVVSQSPPFRDPSSFHSISISYLGYGTSREPEQGHF